MTGYETSNSPSKEIDTCSTITTQLTVSTNSVKTNGNETDDECTVPPPVINGLKRQDNFVISHIPGAYAVTNTFTGLVTSGYESRLNGNNSSSNIVHQSHQELNVTETNVPTVHAELVTNTKLSSGYPSIPKDITFQHQTQCSQYPTKQEEKWISTVSREKYLVCTVIALLILLTIVIAGTTIISYGTSPQSNMEINRYNCKSDTDESPYNQTDIKLQQQYVNNNAGNVPVLDTECVLFDIFCPIFLYNFLTYISCYTIFLL
jgi:hypothetical protein